MNFRSSLVGIVLLVIASVVPVRAETLDLQVSADSYIRASQSNQGANDLAIVGDTATPNDYLRAAFAFDLVAPELVGATINSATLRLGINSQDGGSGSANNTLNLHELGASFTDGGVTWTSRNGTNTWTNPGGDFGAVIATLSANAGTVNPGNTLSFSSTQLTARAVAANGGSLYLLAKLATENTNRSVFRIAAKENVNSSRRPVLRIDYTPAPVDPTLAVDPASPDPDFHFGSIAGNPPFTATRTVRLHNEGPTQSITITSANLSAGSVFSLGNIALPRTLQVGETADLTVTASSASHLPNATATLQLVTDQPAQNRTFPLTAAFLPVGVVPQPAIPGVAASSAYQVRVNGLPVPVNNESYFDFHTAFLSIDRAVEIEVEFSPGVTYQSIHPLRHQLAPAASSNKITFTLLAPLKLVIKAQGALPLAICATPLEQAVPASNDPDVIYFAPGIHEPGLIQPTTGQTVYLAPGALVKGRIETRNASNVTIRGRGTLDSRGYSVRANKTNAILFDRCSDVHIDGIGIRGGTWWQTLFLLTNDATATHLTILGKTVNTDGIDIDGVENFIARDCFIRCEDDGFGWHALDAQANGEPPTRNCLAENCVIWNSNHGNGLRIGASMETDVFEDITFRNIDVLEHAGAAISSDHSDWATCRNIRFENFTDETSKKTVRILILKTQYSNATGYRDERGHYDGLHFTNLTSPGGSIQFSGFDATHAIDNVTFKDCYRGTAPIDDLGDITINAFVTNVSFEINPPAVLPPGAFNLTEPAPQQTQLAWNYGATDPNAFQIERSVTAGPWAPLANLTGDARTLTDPGQLPLTSYRYRIRALDSAGIATAWVGPLAITTSAGSGGTLPEKPAPLTITQTGTGELTLQWQAPATAPNSYRLQRSISGRPLELRAQPTGTATTWLDNTATPGALHTYRLYASNTVGPGSAALVTIIADTWIEAWRRSNFGTPNSAIDTLDPDNDGLTNLAEYALDLDPNQPDSSQDFKIESGENNTHTLSFTSFQPDINYRIQTSLDLIQWSNFDYQEAPLGEINTVPWPPSPSGRAFARLLFLPTAP